MPSAVRRTTSSMIARASCEAVMSRKTSSSAPCLSYASAASTGDRKSTRLNSSHLVISYAVFCLKKKKKRVKYRYLVMTNDVYYDLNKEDHPQRSVNDTQKVVETHRVHYQRRHCRCTSVSTLTYATPLHFIAYPPHPCALLSIAHIITFNLLLSLIFASFSSFTFFFSHCTLFIISLPPPVFFFFFLNDPAPPEISPFPLHDPLPI